MFILTNQSDIIKINIEQLKSLNTPVAKILAIHTSDSEIKKADTDVAYSLEAKLLLTKGSRIMLTINL